MTRQELIDAVKNHAALVAAGFSIGEADEIDGCKMECARLLLSDFSDEKLEKQKTSDEEKTEVELGKPKEAARLRMKYQQFFRESGCDSRKAMDLLLAKIYENAAANI